MKLKSILAAIAATVAVSAHATPLREINISYVKAPFNLQSMVMHEKRLLEQEFANDGVKVNWHAINSGAQQTQAMAAGSLDIGGVMNTTSVLLANSGGNPVLIAAGVSRSAKTFALVAKPGSALSIEQLRGKKIGGPRGTVLHQLLVAALASKNMSIADVDFVSMDIPKAQSALLAGHLDAALLAAGPLVKAIEQGGSLITTAEGLLNPVLVIGASQSFATNHPQILERVLRVHRRASAWVAANREEAIAIGAREQGITMDDARRLAEWSQYFDALTPADISSIKADMRFLLENDMMKSAVKVEQLLLPGATSIKASQ
jgi:sulfonate transport system substrate-binding protein